LAIRAKYPLALGANVHSPLFLLIAIVVPYWSGGLRRIRRMTGS
jgi:hypothetical protein